MKKRIRYIVIGYGWRADFYIKAAQRMPECFENVMRVVRTRERADELVRKGELATENLDQALTYAPDFAVLCVPREAVKGYLEALAEREIPVLCETPPAKNIQELNELWHLAERKGMKIQIAEQYIFWPLYAGIKKIIESGVIGETQMAMLSVVHDYHAMNLFRRFLNIGFENCKIHGETLKSSFVRTESRAGFERSGEMISVQRALASLEFESGKTAIYDFMGEQYNSEIRTRRLNVQGTRGEINDLTVRFLNEKNEGMKEEIRRIDRGVMGNSGWYHLGMQFGTKYIYKNPYPGIRMNDDETAVSYCLEQMALYLENGIEFSTLRDALQDTYLSFIMEDCIVKGKTEVTRAQDWV